MDQSLDSVAESFGRAFASGEAGALTRSGVVLSQTDEDAIKATKSISELAGQQELFNRVLASYQQYAVAAGAGTTDAAKAQGYFATQVGNAQEAIGAAASEARASWQSALTPTLENLNANHQGLLQLIGSTTEYATVAANVGTPVGALIKGFMELKNWANLTKIATLAEAGAHGTAAIATNAHAGANIAAMGAQNAETAAERAKLPVLAAEAAGHQTAAAATLEHAAANRALGASGGAGLPGGAAGAGRGATALKAGGMVATGIGLGVAGYDAIREEGAPDAQQIAGYYKNRLMGQNANESATSALGGDPYAAGGDAEKKSMALFAKMREGGGAQKRLQAGVEARHRGLPDPYAPGETKKEYTPEEIQADSDRRDAEDEAQQLRESYGLPGAKPPQNLMGGDSGVITNAPQTLPIESKRNGDGSVTFRMAEFTLPLSSAERQQRRMVSDDVAAGYG